MSAEALLSIEQELQVDSKLLNPKQSHQEKQPRTLYFISASNLWERFGYYTTRGILVLYMVKNLLFSHEKAYSIFAAFTALLYLAPLLGGDLVDRFLGAKRGVILGGLLGRVLISV